MPVLKTCERMMETCKNNNGLKKDDIAVLLTAGLLLLVGTGISIGGCALRVREEREKYNEKKENEMSVQEQKIPSSLKLQKMLERE